MIECGGAGFGGLERAGGGMGEMCATGSARTQLSCGGTDAAGGTTLVFTEGCQFWVTSDTRGTPMQRVFGLESCSRSGLA